MAKKKDEFAGVPSQTVAPQVERYPGSDVLGMEETTARPLNYETGCQDFDLRMPGKPWYQWSDYKSMRHASHTNGKANREEESEIRVEVRLIK